jgi:hypothetical protein
MIPDLDDGVLPEGIHDCTIAELELAFGQFQQTDRRPLLTKRLKAYIKAARLSRTALAVIIDGSYVTKKPVPGDIDLIVALRPDLDLTVELAPLEYNVQSRRRVRTMYGFDIRAAVDGSDTYNSYVHEFSRIRKDDPDQQTSRLRKGLLRVLL